LTVGRIPVGSGSDFQETMATRGRSSSSLHSDATQRFLQFAMRQESDSIGDSPHQVP
jgi:hypothetical protein